MIKCRFYLRDSNREHIRPLAHPLWGGIFATIAMLFLSATSIAHPHHTEGSGHADHPEPAAATNYSAYHVGLDFIQSSVPAPPTFVFGLEPFAMTTPSNYFVTQGGFAGWTEEDAQRAIAMAVEDAYYDIDVGDPNKVVNINFYIGAVSPSLSGQRLNIFMAQSAFEPWTFLGESLELYNQADPDNYVAVTYIDEIDKLGDGFVTYDTAEGVINAIAGTTAHEIGHTFTAEHVATLPGDPDPRPLMSTFNDGLAWVDRLVERRFSTALPAGTSNALRIQQSASTADRSDINLDETVNAADAGAMFANWGLDDRLRHEGDVTGDHLVNAADSGMMFAAWSADPGPTGPGTAVADYDPTTGEIIVSIDGVNNWFIESASNGLTGDTPTLGLIPGALPSDGDGIIGETAFAVATAASHSLGNVAALGLAEGDLTISWNAGLGQPLQTALVLIIPEPATLALAAFGLCGVLATRRRFTAKR